MHRWDRDGVLERGNCLLRRGGGVLSLPGEGGSMAGVMRACRTFSALPSHSRALFEKAGTNSQSSVSRL